MAEYHNLERAAQQLQQRLAFLQRLGLGLDVLLGGALAALLATVLITLLGRSVPWPAVYGALAVVSVGVFAGLAWRVRSATLDVLASADRVLGFHASPNAIGGVHDNAANAVIAQLLLDFGNNRRAVAVNFDGVVNFGLLFGRKFNVHDRARDLDNASDVSF